MKRTQLKGENKHIVGYIFVRNLFSFSFSFTLKKSSFVASNFDFITLLYIIYYYRVIERELSKKTDLFTTINSILLIIITDR